MPQAKAHDLANRLLRLVALAHERYRDQKGFAVLRLSCLGRVDAAYVDSHLGVLVQDLDLSRYIL